MKEIEIYIHIPYCVRKCRYCDFLSYANASCKEKKTYFEKLADSIRGDSNYVVRSVFFGGGTPSSVDAEYICGILEKIKKEYRIKDNAEITLEANPGTLTPGKLKAYKDAGFNRLSMGVQSLNDELLKTMGRIHTAEEARQGFKMAREAGFDNINTDLILGYPTQTKKMFGETLDEIIEMGPEHISAYSLIVEEETPLYDAIEKGDLPEPSDEDDREMYRMACEKLKAAGYEQYEISNFAKPGYESIHNTGYWTGVPYIGYGIAAASYIDGKRLSNNEDLLPMLEERVDKETAEKEFMMLGFRLTKGPDSKSFFEMFGEGYEEKFAEILTGLENKKLIDKCETGYRLSAKGIDFANEVFGEFI